MEIIVLLICLVILGISIFHLVKDNCLITGHQYEFIDGYWFCPKCENINSTHGLIQDLKRKYNERNNL